MVASVLGALQPGYAPFIHTGRSNGSHTHPERRALLRQRQPDTFGLWGVLNGTLRVIGADGTHLLHGPAAAFITPDPDRIVEAPAGSDWYGLRFDLTEQPRRRRAEVGKRAWCHDGPVRQPDPAALWGVTPRQIIPPNLVASAIQVLRDCCSLWWQDDLAHIQANASLGHWLVDYAMACRTLYPDEPGDQRLRARCQRLVLERLHQGIGIADLAAATGYSVSRFTELFQHETGKRPGAFIRNCRLSEAARLLASEDLSIAMVATRCGYRSRAAFIRAFTRRFLASPAEWRRRRR